MITAMAGFDEKDVEEEVVVDSHIKLGTILLK